MNDKLAVQTTKSAYILTRLFDAPFWAIFNMLSFILYKDLHATPFQLAMLITLKPLVSIFSSYWSSHVNNRRDRLIPNILSARLLAALPFFFFPWVSNPWFFVASFGFYMMLALGIVPAWMEILKLNLPDKVRENIFSYAQISAYSLGAFLPYLLGGILDEYSQAWRWIFPSAALLALVSSFFQLRITIPPQKIVSQPPTTNFGHYLLKPWKNSWNILKEHPDFLKFQTGFMLFGCGLMIMQPVLTIFFVDELKLSYTEMAVALAFFKGVGFLIGSPLWSKWIHRLNINYLCGIVAIIASFFPLGLICAKSFLFLLYLSYFAYGFLQAGNELAWNLSGPIFSKGKDSSAFTTVNVIAIGVRGCFIPFIGSTLSIYFGSVAVMVLGGFICLLATFHFIFYKSRVLTVAQ